MSLQKKTRKLPQFFYRWHRRIGASAALFFIWIVLSGWLLNHSEAFNLTKIELQNHFLASWYGLKPQLPDKVFITPSHWITGNKEQWFMDGRPLSIKAANLVSVAESKNFIGLLSDNQLLLLDSKGKLIDRLDTQDLSVKQPTKLGVACGEKNLSALIIADEKNSYFSDNGLDWSECNQPTQWTSQRAPTELEKQQLNTYLLPKISLEKIILDLHTGRFFGTLGVFIVDFLGLCLILLAASGLWLFLRRQNKHS